MRSFWVKRGEWVIGPVTDHQIRAMARQQWFRSNDLVGIGHDGPWANARSVVPASGFNTEQTPKRESPLEPASSSSSAGASSPPSRPSSASQSAKPFEPTESDSPPAWFRTRKRQRRPVPGDRSSGSSGDGIDEPAGVEPSLVNDLFGPPPSLAREADEAVDRFHTAEVETVGGVEHVDEIQQDQERSSLSGDWNFDVAAGLAADDDADSESQGRSRGSGAQVPEQPEIDEDEESARKPVTDWELVIGDLDDGDVESADDQAAESFAPSVHNLRTGKTHEASESAVSAELDFGRLANLAAADPALSRTSLPAAHTVQARRTSMSSEERGLRKTAASDVFQSLLSLLCLVIGLQASALSALINGLVFVAFFRFLKMSTSVFVPWGDGPTEILEGSGLALAGTGMAVAFALPFLPFSYLMRMDGRVLAYLISLAAALIPAVAIGTGGMNSTAEIIFVCLMLAVPAAVAAVVSGMLARQCNDQTLQRLLIGGCAMGVVLAASIAFAAPNFSISNQLFVLPPELQLTGGWVYVTLLFYSAQLTLLYFVLDRIARTCCDETTLAFMQQHLLFHWLLTFTAFVLTGAVHMQAASGWGSAPVLLGALTAIVALGFNLWSLVRHLEPRFDRMRVD